jgi:hypothetical protein
VTVLSGRSELLKLWEMGIYGLVEQLIAFTKECNLRVYFCHATAKCLLFRLSIIVFVQR